MAAHPLQRPAHVGQDFASAVFEISDALLVLLDREGRIVRFNPACERVSGYRFDEVEGRAPWDVLVPPEKANGVRESFLHVIENPEVPTDGEHLWVSKLGEGIPIRWTDSTILDSTGAVEYVVCTGIDLREQHEALRALRESEERFRNAFDLAPIGMSLTSSPGGGWLKANRALCDMLGYSEEELYATTFEELTHPEDRESTVALARRLHAAEVESFEVEKRYLHKDGHAVWVNLIGSLVRDSSGRPAWSIGQMQDVTERKRAEAALQETTAMLSAIFDASPAAIVTFDRTGLVTSWNNAAEQMFGWTSEEVLGNLPPYVDEGVDQEFRRNLERSMVGVTTLNERFRRVRKDGTQIELSASAAPLRNATGEIVGMAAVLIDFSERKRLEEELVQAQRLESVGRLAGGIAHDFNNILTAISGYAELLLADISGDDPRRAHAEEIGRASERAGALVRQLLTFGRKQFLQPRVMSLNDVLTGLDPMLRRLIGEDIELVLTCSPALGNVQADPAQVEQTVVNLVVNARDAMPEGGRLEIASEHVELAETAAEPLGIECGSYAVLRVQDTGVGLDEETKSHIFEPFFTTKEPGKGTGLGLATAYGLVTQSGGAIQVESAPRAGATFSVYLPEVETAKGSGSALEQPTSTGVGSKTILLVEDEEAVRRLANRILTDDGYLVLLAVDAAEALSLASEGERPIDLLLTDVVLPGMGGRELAERLRVQNPGLHVLFSSGYPDDAVLRLGIAGHRAAYLAKPFSGDRLRAAVRRAIEIETPTSIVAP